MVPWNWECAYATYGDGTCDCGCGVQDPDCSSAAVAECESCNTAGSCARGVCPSSIDPNDNTKCAVPANWTCDPSLYGDGTCDCGCNVTDMDCSSTDASACWGCSWDSCSPGCVALDTNDNAHCTSAPTSWTCPARLYHDGSHCDCGCGAFDPDCASLGESACAKCDDSGSCSKQACPGTITTGQNWSCTRPTPPTTWKCSSYYYADGYACDCGCGAPDPDCATTDVSECTGCPACNGYCPASIDPNDTTRCLPPPSGWSCDDSLYGDFVCDCGCGAVDVDCYDTNSYNCGNCPEDGCTAGICSHLDPQNNAVCKIQAPSSWTCSRAYYGDGVCDCGCGALDPDCASASEQECIYCNSQGSCSTAACPGTISLTDNSTCSQ